MVYWWHTSSRQWFWWKLLSTEMIIERDKGSDISFTIAEENFFITETYWFFGKFWSVFSQFYCCTIWQRVFGWLTQDAQGGMYTVEGLATASKLNRINSIINSIKMRSLLLWHNHVNINEIFETIQHEIQKRIVQKLF